jgi:hypothetical protein
MKVDPERIKALADGLDGIQQEFSDVLDVEPQIKDHLDLAAIGARAKYETVTEGQDGLQ